MCTGSLGGGRRPARKRASSDPRGSVKTLALPPRSPNLNAYAERWVRSVREECLAKLILLGEGSLRRALLHYAQYCPSPKLRPTAESRAYKDYESAALIR